MKFSVIDYAFCLTGRTFDRTGGAEGDLGGNTEQRFQCFGKRFFCLGDLGDGVREDLCRYFYANLEGIEVVNAVNQDEVVGGIAFSDEDGFDLRGEDVNAADDEHIVRSAARL